MHLNKNKHILYNMQSYSQWSHFDVECIQSSVSNNVYVHFKFRHFIFFSGPWRRFYWCWGNFFYLSTPLVLHKSLPHFRQYTVNSWDLVLIMFCDRKKAPQSLSEQYKLWTLLVHLSRRLKWTFPFKN